MHSRADNEDSMAGPDGQINHQIFHLQYTMVSSSFMACWLSKHKVAVWITLLRFSMNKACKSPSISRHGNSDAVDKQMSERLQSSSSRRLREREEE